MGLYFALLPLCGSAPMKDEREDGLRLRVPGSLWKRQIHRQVRRSDGNSVGDGRWGVICNIPRGFSTFKMGGGECFKLDLDRKRHFEGKKHPFPFKNKPKVVDAIFEMFFLGARPNAL